MINYFKWLFLNLLEKNIVNLINREKTKKLSFKFLQFLLVISFIIFLALILIEKFKKKKAWVNEFLHWTPSEEGNCSSLNIEVNSIWKPGKF